MTKLFALNKNKRVTSQIFLCNFKKPIEIFFIGYLCIFVNFLNRHGNFYVFPGIVPAFFVNFFTEI